MGDNMKRFVIILSIILGVCFFFYNKDENSEIRIRVISNSDSNSDIEYKKEVVSYLKEILSKNSLTDNYFKNNKDEIELKLKSRYPNVKVKYEMHNFTKKSYNGNVVKDGKYKTLLVLIDEAKGPNWWCSIFAGKITKESDEILSYEWYFNKRYGEVK